MHVLFRVFNSHIFTNIRNYGLLCSFILPLKPRTFVMKLYKPPPSSVQTTSPFNTPNANLRPVPLEANETVDASGRNF